jgi:hypothetical protein
LDPVWRRNRDRPLSDLYDGHARRDLPGPLRSLAEVLTAATEFRQSGRSCIA